MRALARLVELADDPENHVTMELRPGDMQFINNYHVLHGRTAYEDDRAAGRVRHLKRLWLETDVLEDRPPYFANNVASHWNARRSASRMQVR
jgi:alpha-ketoglutarate-dependent taurine dioxygenase